MLNIFFIFQKSIKKIKFNFKIYIWIIIELSIGFGLIVYCINTNIQSNIKYNNIISEIGENKILIEGTKQNNISNNISINKENYSYISANYSQDIEISYMIMTKFKPISSTKEINILFVTPQFYKINLYVDNIFNEYNTVFIGNNVYQTIVEQNISNITLREDILEINGESINLSLLNVENIGNNIISVKEYGVKAGEIDTANSIIIPMRYYSLFNNINITSCLLTLKFSDKYSYIDISNISKDICRYLYLSNNKEFNYKYSNRIDDLNYQMIVIKSETSLFLFLGIMGILIMTFGISGIFIIFLEKRKYEISISMAVGATTLNIYIEYLIEILIILLIGNILGCIIGTFIINEVGSYLFEVVISPLSYIIIILCCFFIISFVLIFSLTGIKKMNPMEVLRNIK